MVYMSRRIENNNKIYTILPFPLKRDYADRKNISHV